MLMVYAYLTVMLVLSEERDRRANEEGAHRRATRERERSARAMMKRSNWK